jgi:hypothetical protein
MRHVTVNFVPPAGSTARQGSWGHAALTRHTCLTQNVERLHRLGLSRGTTLDVVLVGDLTDVPDGYAARLEELGAQVHVETDVYLRLAAEFPNVVERFAGPYGIFSFALLRWLLVDALFPGETVACYDGDVVHAMPLADIAAAIGGRTGTGTSTAFVAVGDRSWFESWRRNLKRLDSDLEGFWRRAADATGFAALPEVYRYSAEEYFAKALIESGELPQDLELSLPGCWLLVQPQYLPRLYAYTRPPGASHAPTPLVYRRSAGVDFLNDRPVAFWHLQKPFLGLLGVVNARPACGLDTSARVRPLDFYGFAATDEWVRMADEYLKEFPYPFDPYYDEAPYPLDPVDDEERRVLRRHRRAMQQRHGFGPENPFSLAAVCERFFGEDDLSALFNPETWPVQGVWEEQSRAA